MLCDDKCADIDNSTTLELLPSKVLYKPAKGLASLTLSTVITLKHAHDTLSCLKSSLTLPKSAWIIF